MKKGSRLQFGISLALVAMTLIYVSHARAGRPVIEQLTLTELGAQSELIFVGWPSSTPAFKACQQVSYKWYVNRVLKGDKNLEGKIIGIAHHQYKIHALKHAPSYAAKKYADEFNTEQSSSALFVNPRPDNCFELAAQGAQERKFPEDFVKAVAIGPTDCELQENTFEKTLLGGLPTACKTDSECTLLPIHPNSCHVAMPFNKAAEAELKGEWLTHIARVKAACKEKYGKSPACSLQVMPVRCHKSECKIGIPVSAMPKFTTANLQNGCAPHDGLSTILNVNTGKSPYPQFSMNWWSENRPQRKPGIYRANLSGDQRKEFASSYCPVQKGCQMIKELKVSLELKTESTGNLDFYFKTTEDEEFRGNLPVKFSPSSVIPCG